MQPTWEMELRNGVAFHDGTPFTSADVIFSIERSRADLSSHKADVSGVAGVEAVDADTVRFTAASANPIPWEAMPWVPIMSKVWVERHGAALPSQLGDDRWDYVETHANGTGPFVLEELEPGERMVLVRNPNWWGLAQHPHNIDRIVQTQVDDPARGAQLLFAGEIDVLQSPPADQLERIAATPGLKSEGRERSYALPRLRPSEPRAQLLERQGAESVRRPARAPGVLPGHRHRAYRRGAPWSRGPGRHGNLAEGHRLVGGARPPFALRSREGQGVARRGRLS